MGADIFLQSVWKPFEEKLSRTRKPEPSFKSPAECEAFMSGLYDEMRGSGGYFRNGYNSGDVMWAMGLSWHGTVVPMLDQGYLPVARAHELVAMIEARPLTRERVAAHMFDNMTSGVELHPLNGQLLQSLEEAATGQTLRPKLPPDFDHLFQFLNARRDELLAILRRSLELNEPLFCDL